MSEWIRLRKSPEDRRVKILRIAPRMFLHLLTPDGTRLIRQQGIPVDAEIIALEHDVVRATIDFVIHSEEFDPVDPAVWPPDLEVIYEELMVVEAGGA